MIEMTELRIDPRPAESPPMALVRRPHPRQRGAAGGRQRNEFILVNRVVAADAG